MYLSTDRGCRSRIGLLLGVACVAGLLAAAGLAASSEGRSVPCHGRCWHPPLRAAWNYVLSRPPDLRIRADMYDVDLFDTSKRIVRRIHRAGRHAVCYLDAGTWERWRADAHRFPASVLGRGNGWPGERWLDIRRRDVLQPIMRRRLDRCRAKHFDGVEFDNVDGYANSTGFPLSADDQLRYDTWLARAAHARGLTAALKNDLGQASRLERAFDYAVDEQCFQFHECRRLEPFVREGKAVFEVEYRPQPHFCARARRLGLSAIRKSRSLGNAVRSCH
jgi:hypothetical protein